MLTCIITQMRTPQNMSRVLKRFFRLGGSVYFFSSKTKQRFYERERKTSHYFAYTLDGRTFFFWSNVDILKCALAAEIDCVYACVYVQIHFHARITWCFINGLRKWRRINFMILVIVGMTQTNTHTHKMCILFPKILKFAPRQTQKHVCVTKGILRWFFVWRQFHTKMLTLTNYCI